ncbi:taste receptor type 2 member 20-like [Bufo gargarizans]|uniref:taste receptor type 2 member 20-like n=1 Tax=Bufo gargarizans TaxID=30331 RepID=UPI001CF56C9E|nr:taste receptor type 2 member 20-like [Bufo gargarizans]
MEEMKTMFNATNERNYENNTLTSSTSLTSYDLLSLGILVLETIVGTFMNGLMVIVNLISLVTLRKLGSCDSILACLGLSRFTFTWLVLVVYLINDLSPKSADTGTTGSLQYVWLFFNDLSLWLASWLSTFYCVRIVNIERYIFTAFKTHFDRLVPFLILASIVISALCSNSTASDGINQTFNMSKFQHNQNSTPFAAMGNNFATFATLSAVGSIPPFFLFCVSAGLVVDSLLRHVKNMKGQERTGFREPSLDAHYQAVKMMVAFFMFFLLYMMAFNLYGSGMVKSDILSCFAAFFIGAYPSLHSVLLVFGNRKLKHTFLWILQKAFCSQKQLDQTMSD